MHFIFSYYGNIGVLAITRVGQGSGPLLSFYFYFFSLPHFTVCFPYAKVAQQNSHLMLYSRAESPLRQLETRGRLLIRDIPAGSELVLRELELAPPSH